MFQMNHPFKNYCRRKRNTAEINYQNIPEIFAFFAQYFQKHLQTTRSFSRDLKAC